MAFSFLVLYIEIFDRLFKDDDKTREEDKSDEGEGDDRQGDDSSGVNKEASSSGDGKEQEATPNSGDDSEEDEESVEILVRVYIFLCCKFVIFNRGKLFIVLNSIFF